MRAEALEPRLTDQIGEVRRIGSGFPHAPTPLLDQGDALWQQFGGKPLPAVRHFVR